LEARHTCSYGSLTRPRAFLRAWRGLGLVAALKLIRIRSGAREKIYRLRVPQWPHPVFVRGGTSSDAIVLYEILATGEYGHIGDLGSPKLVIDAGANVGSASIYFLNRYPDTQIVAIEPDPQSIELCRKNLAPYSKRVTILQGPSGATPAGFAFSQTTRNLPPVSAMPEKVKMARWKHSRSLRLLPLMEAGAPWTC